MLFRDLISIKAIMLLSNWTECVHTISFFFLYCHCKLFSFSNFYNFYCFFKTVICFSLMSGVIKKLQSKISLLSYNFEILAYRLLIRSIMQSQFSLYVCTRLFPTMSDMVFIFSSPRLKVVYIFDFFEWEPLDQLQPNLAQSSLSEGDSSLLI